MGGIHTPNRSILGHLGLERVIKEKEKKEKDDAAAAILDMNMARNTQETEGSC